MTKPPARRLRRRASIWSLEDPENPRRLGHYKTGGDGTHRNFYAGGRYVHTTALPKGYQGHIYQIVDIADPARPVEVSRWWRKGQWIGGGETGATKDVLLHGGAYVKGERRICLTARAASSSSTSRT